MTTPEVEAGSIDRRTLIKRAAIAGGIVWAAPVLTSLGQPAAAATQKLFRVQIRFTGSGCAISQTYSTDPTCQPAGYGAALDGSTRVTIFSCNPLIVDIPTGQNCTFVEGTLKRSGTGTCIPSTVDTSRKRISFPLQTGIDGNDVARITLSCGA